MNKPHYTEELKKETANQEKIRAFYESLFSGLPIQKYDFAKDNIGSLQLT